MQEVWLSLMLAPIERAVQDQLPGEVVLTDSA